MARTLSNITDNFKAGEVYNIGGTDFHSIEEAADIILRLTGKTEMRDKLITYQNEEILTTRKKLVDSSKARRDLDHKTLVTLEEGIKNTVEWMKTYYEK